MAWLWSRGEHNIRDYWVCQICEPHGVMRKGGEGEALDHLREHGHAVGVWHESERFFHPAGFTGDADRPVGHAHQ